MKETDPASIGIKARLGVLGIRNGHGGNNQGLAGAAYSPCSSNGGELVAGEL